MEWPNPAIETDAMSAPPALTGAAHRERSLRHGEPHVKLDVYGRFQLEVLREENSWIAYRIGLGKRVRDTSFVIPDSLAADEIPSYIDDLFHELCGPGQTVRVVA